MGCGWSPAPTAALHRLSVLPRASMFTETLFSLSRGNYEMPGGCQRNANSQPQASDSRPFATVASVKLPVSPPFLLSSQSIHRGLLPTPYVHPPTALSPARMVCSTVPILFPVSGFLSRCVLETSPTEQLWLAQSQNVGAGKGHSAPLPTFLRSGNWKPETGQLIAGLTDIFRSRIHVFF